ncbi:MAG TPA: hypothetical protein VFL15_01630 [Gammaproteobacteria bacterium]|nr:hypothetical protein [Gammaproteobacteria bacterium]
MAGDLFIIARSPPGCVDLGQDRVRLLQRAPKRTPRCLSSMEIRANAEIRRSANPPLPSFSKGGSEENLRAAIEQESLVMKGGVI